MHEAILLTLRDAADPRGGCGAAGGCCGGAPDATAAGSGDPAGPDACDPGAHRCPPADTDLITRLGLPREPAAVAAAVLVGQERRLDLLRNDGGSVTLHGTLLGEVDERGQMLPFRAHIEVDAAVLSNGTEALVAVV